MLKLQAISPSVFMPQMAFCIRQYFTKQTISRIKHSMAYHTWKTECPSPQHKRKRRTLHSHKIDLTLDCPLHNPGGVHCFPFDYFPGSISAAFYQCAYDGNFYLWQACANKETRHPDCPIDGCQVHFGSVKG